MAKDDKTQKPVTSSEVKPNKIMTQPLPQILNGIEDSIKLSEEYSPIRDNMKQSPGFISTFKLGQYDVVNTLSGATPTAHVKLEPIITNVSGTGLSRTATTQITNTGNSDAHNAVGQGRGIFTGLPG